MDINISNIDLHTPEWFDDAIDELESKYVEVEICSYPLVDHIIIPEVAITSRLSKDTDIVIQNEYFLFESKQLLNDFNFRDIEFRFTAKYLVDFYKLHKQLNCGAVLVKRTYTLSKNFIKY